ncbi:MAG TPA: hypothetical protein VE999_01600 [Gemmataceae bacterium]|nr:hypothetical protein [Bryobacteraceae bacterium]HZV03760.1 hypothetical protein [Gemmataceae bacterium]
MITLQRIEHAVASVAHDIVKIARAVVPVLQKVQGQEATVEALTSLVDPNAVNIERAAFAVLGKVCVAITDAGNAVAANGLNLQLDAQEIADLKAVAAYLQGATKSAVIAASTLVPAKA